MSLDIYSEVSQDSAVAAFGSGRPAKKFVDGVFVVLDRAVLCFSTVGSLTGPCLVTPRRLRWCPRGGPVRGGDLNWWPRAVVDVYDRSGSKPQRLRQHHIFLGGGAEPTFLYAGPAHLGSYGADRTADFELELPLPHAIWLRFGGYSGWRLEIEHDQIDLAAGDELSLNAHLAAFAAQSFSHLSLTRYEDDSLHIYKNERCAWLMYLREPVDDGLHVSRRLAASDTRHERFRCDCGIELIAAANQTVAVPEALEIVRFFFRRGSLPSNYDWTDEC